VKSFWPSAWGVIDDYGSSTKAWICARVASSSASIITWAVLYLPAIVSIVGSPGRKKKAPEA
jgi:hypothetical protein